MISRYRTSLTICFNKFPVDGHVANCDCVQVHLVRLPLFIFGVVARSVFSFTGDVLLWRLPASSTLNGQGSSLRSTLSHRVQSSVRFVPKDPFVAKRRTCSCSHPNNQGVDLFVSVILIAKFPKLTFPQSVSVLLNHVAGGSGGIISMVSFVDSSSSTSSPWSDTVELSLADVGTLPPSGTQSRKGNSRRSNFSHWAQT